MSIWQMTSLLSIRFVNTKWFSWKWSKVRDVHSSKFLVPKNWCLGTWKMAVNVDVPRWYLNSKWAHRQADPYPVRIIPLNQALPCSILPKKSWKKNLEVQDQTKWLVFRMIHVKDSLLPMGKVWLTWTSSEPSIFPTDAKKTTERNHLNLQKVAPIGLYTMQIRRKCFRK